MPILSDLVDTKSILRCIWAEEPAIQGQEILCAKNLTAKGPQSCQCSSLRKSFQNVKGILEDADLHIKRIGLTEQKKK